jgi:hypothetical protein
LVWKQIADKLERPKKNVNQKDAVGKSLTKRIPHGASIAFNSMNEQHNEQLEPNLLKRTPLVALAL